MTTASTNALMFSTSCLLGEARLADAGMHDAGLLDAELDRAALGALDRCGDVHGDGADARVRHQAARTQHLAEPAHQTHHVGRGDAAVEVDRALATPARPDPPRRRRRRRRPSPPRPWRPWRTRRRAACGPSRWAALHTPRTIWSACLGSTPRFIATSIGLVELGLGARLDHLHRLVDGDRPSRDRRPRATALQTLADLGSLRFTPPPAGPSSAPSPRCVLAAASRSSVFKSFIFTFAISRTCAIVMVPALVAARLLGAAADLGRLLEEVRRRRRPHLEGEGAVREDGDLHRDRRALLHVLGLGVELLAELHDVDRPR